MCILSSTFQITTSDWIQIAGIVITAIIGVWIAEGVQNNVNKSRALRDFFIQELTALQQDYRDFANAIFSSQLSANEIKVRFKSFATRITALDDYIHKKFEIKGSLVKDAHFKLRQELTEHEEFNEQFKNDVVSFSSTTKASFQSLHLELTKAITERIINVNESRIRGRHWWNKNK